MDGLLNWQDLGRTGGIADSGDGQSGPLLHLENRYLPEAAPVFFSWLYVWGPRQISAELTDPAAACGA